jgi:hypothetical protein
VRSADHHDEQSRADSGADAGAPPDAQHGFNNTLGLLTFFVVSPVHGFW